jgi:hypothetical protein
MRKLAFYNTCKCEWLAITSLREMCAMVDLVLIAYLGALGLAGIIYGLIRYFLAEFARGEQITPPLNHHNT